MSPIGRPAAGNIWTCFAHIITGIIGAGVLALSWSVAQLGWVGGPVAMLCFAFVTYLSAFLMTHCYRSPVCSESDAGSQKRQRNYSYMDAVRSHLGTIAQVFFFSRSCDPASLGVLACSYRLSMDGRH